MFDRKAIDKFVKLISKEERVFIQMSEEKVYIVTPYYGVKLPAAVYHDLLEGLSPALREYKPGRRYNYDSKRFEHIYEAENDLSCIFTTPHPDQVATVDTHLNTDIKCGKSTTRAALLYGRQIIAVNRKFFEPIDDLMSGEAVRYSSGRVNPVVYEGEEARALILPIRLENEYVDALNKALKEAM